ncbi:SAM-dependent DNA methyltransferase [Desulfallas sp. Bu1-1]|uniref:DUF6094 domain-containing protein n=1 Tax=Desulfallas sp. Bu1-1 TaxID=2787620 RepID=UPI00189E3930|nr:DUF6094 domain-containing protein [Desulfallas sp. Bu1-1]MBF7084729.1 SAM-dependent DNA methyltransferase [Desulfallas sp. Bu1-1]
MARSASREKGGYYPTPADELKLVCKKLYVELGSSAALLDPCAGTGEALKIIADSLTSQGGSITTYGIELEETRAAECKKIIDFALKCDYKQARVSTKAFSFLWLNPPYDSIGHERTEVIFLRDLTDPVLGKLMEGGVLGFCIPQYVLAHAAPLLAARFDELAVFRFTDANYPVFKQVVVLGVRRSKARRGEEARAIREWLKELAGGGPDMIPPLDAENDTFYLIPSQPDKKISFRGSLLDPAEIREDIANSPVWEEIGFRLMPYKKGSILKNPILPLKPAHNAIAIAAGAIGGNMGNHLLVGRTVKVVDKEVIPEEKGERVIERDRYITTVRVFAPHLPEGVYDLE